MLLKAAYEKKLQEIEFNLELINTSSEVKEVTFSSGKQFDIYVVNEAGEEVYRYSDDKFFTMALLMKELAPGEVLRWTDTWRYTSGEASVSGKFKAYMEVLANLNHEVEEESSLMEVVELSL